VANTRPAAGEGKGDAAYAVRRGGARPLAALRATAGTADEPARAAADQLKRRATPSMSAATTATSRKSEPTVRLVIGRASGSTGTIDAGTTAAVTVAARGCSLFPTWTKPTKPALTASTTASTAAWNAC
jgi:hypothetical protein